MGVWMILISRACSRRKVAAMLSQRESTGRGVQAGGLRHLSAATRCMVVLIGLVAVHISGVWQCD